MEYSDLRKRVYDEIGKDIRQPTYNEALLRVLAPFLPSYEPTRNMCPICGYQDYHIKPSRFISDSKPETLVKFLIHMDMLSPGQKGWAVEYYKREPEAFWKYIKLSNNIKEK